MEFTNQKPKKRPTKIEEMTKEQIREAILKKRECNARAQKIVESLLERGVTDTYILQCLPDINQAHFEDIIEERSIIHLCGYPICQKALSVKDIPKQKYRISLKTNKVYDITARKSFCSNACYNAAIYVKKQMLTSPLWFREYENIPKFHLLNLDLVGTMGEEVDVTLIERVKISDNKKSFTSINDFAKASLNEMSNNCQDEKDDHSEHTTSSKSEFKLDASTIEHVNENVNKNNESACDTNEDRETHINQASDANSCSDQDNGEHEKRTNNNICTQIYQAKTEKSQCIDSSVLETNKSVKKDIKPAPNPLNIVGDIIEKPERKIDPILTTPISNIVENESKEIKTKKVPQKKQPLVTVLTIEVEKCLAEWFTLDTVLLLFGEEKVREMVADKGECIKEYLNNYGKGIFYSSNAYDQYQALCKKLNMLELEDRKFDSQTLKRETKPLPDYTMLQEESKKMQLKVKAFFSGEIEIPEPVIEEPIQSKEETEGNHTNLPLVDKNSQNALRRRIVCQHLNKVLPDILRSLGLLSLSISSDIRLLVNTFKLKANNIMFKPIQWTLIAIIFIKLLSLRDKRLEYLLEQPTAYQHMQLLLLSYKQDGGYLDRLICWLTDIDRLLDTNDTQLTIE